MAMCSYFGGFRLRQPLPAEIGAGISGGSVGNPGSPAGSGDAADASCTGAREVSSNMTTGEMAGQTALNPPRLTTVAWPRPACQGGHDLNTTGVCLPNGCPPFTYWP